MTMSDTIKNLNQWAVEYQKTNNQDVFNKIYKQVLPYLTYNSKTDEEFSDAQWVLFNVVRQWKEDSGVWFFVYLKLCLRNHKNGVKLYNMKDKRVAQTVPLQGTVGWDSKRTYAETVKDESSMDGYDNVLYQPNMARIKAYMKYHTKEKPQQYQVFIMLLEGKKQQEMADILGVSQSRIAKIISNIKKEKYAEKLKMMLKGDI